MGKIENIQDYAKEKRINESDGKIKQVPIYHKSQLTVEEAAAYSGIGQHKIRELAKREDANFTLHCGRKLLIKRRMFDDYIEHQLVI